MVQESVTVRGPLRTVVLPVTQSRSARRWSNCPERLKTIDAQNVWCSSTRNISNRSLCTGATAPPQHETATIPCRRPSRDNRAREPEIRDRTRPDDLRPNLRQVRIVPHQSRERRRARLHLRARREFYHESDIRIAEHYTDTYGFTDHVFGLIHLLGSGSRHASAY